MFDLSNLAAFKQLSQEKCMTGIGTNPRYRNMKGITPYLQVTKTGEAIAWYERVFGAKEVRTRLVAPDGTYRAESEIANLLEELGLEIEEGDKRDFMRIVGEELQALHEGNYARYRLRPSEFEAWLKR